MGQVKIETVADTLDVPAGKKLEVKEGEIAGVKEGTEVTTFNLSDKVKFKVTHAKETPAKKQHVPDGTIIEIHPLDAAVMEKQGKGKIVK